MMSASHMERGAQADAGAVARLIGRLSPREAWMLAILGVIALLVADSYALQWSAAQRDRYAAAETDLALTRESRIALQRPSERGALEAQISAAQAWTTRAHDVWLARLAIEQRLSAAAAVARLPAPQIKVAERLDTASGVPQLTAEVTGPYLPRPWIGFMAALSAGDAAVLIDKLDISDAEAAQFDLMLSIPVTLQTSVPRSAT